MKTAQGSISVDVSKFVAGIELATVKLLTLREAIERSSSVAKAGFRVYDASLAIAAKIKSIQEQWKMLGDAISAFQNIAKTIPNIFNTIKATAQGALNAVRNMPPLFQKITIVAVSAGVALYAFNKAMSAISSSGKSVINAIGGIGAKLISIGKAGVSGIGGILSGVFSGLGSVAKTLGISIGGVSVALGALDRFFKIGIVSAIELGDEYNTLSKRTGASVGYLYDLGKILKDNGASATYGATAITHMQRALTGVNELGQPTADIFKQLNLNIKDLQNDTASASVEKIAKAILGLKNPALQARAATEVFGKAGSAMIAAFKDENFVKISQNTSAAGQSLEKNAENFSRISSKLRDSGSFFREFFIQLAGEVAPEILELFKMFQGGDTLSKFGKDLGASIKKGLDVLIGAFKTGNLLEMLKAVFDIVSAYAQDLLGRAFVTASNILTKIFEGNVIPVIFGAFVDMLSGLAEFISGIFLKGLKEPILFFKNAFDNIIQEIVVNLAEGLVNALIPFSKELKVLGINVSEKLGVRKGLEKSGLILSPEQISQKNEGNIDAQISKATGKGTGISAVAEGAKSLMVVAKDIFGILTEEITKMGNMTPETAKKIADATGKLNAYAVAAQVTGVETGKATGQSELGAKTKADNGMKDMAVASLQKIGGGGGAFGGDPLIQLNKAQLEQQKEQTAVLKQIVKKSNPSGYASGGGENNWVVFSNS
jgi:hypothetical protein